MGSQTLLSYIQISRLLNISNSKALLKPIGNGNLKRFENVIILKAWLVFYVIPWNITVLCHSKSLVFVPIFLPFHFESTYWKYFRISPTMINRHSCVSLNRTSPKHSATISLMARSFSTWSGKSRRWISLIVSITMNVFVESNPIRKPPR